MSGSDENAKPSAMSALKGMFSFFTMLPINIDQKNIDDMNRCFWLIPFIGLFFGLLAVLIFYFTGYYVSETIAAALTIFIVGMMNRFLHLDGTIDVGDGLTVAGKREDHLRALKDTLIGAGGMATGVLVLLLTFSEYVSLSVIPFIFIGFSAEVLARNAQVAAAAWGTAGNGMAGASVRCSSTSSLVKSSILTVIILALFMFIFKVMTFEYLGFSVPNYYWYAIAAAFVSSIVWGYVMSKVAERNFGMVNGDVLGATNETARAVLLFIMIAIVSVAAGI